MGANRTPVHETIATHYRGLILSGRIQPGERLPPVRDVARRMKVSITPVKTSYRKLEQEGLIFQRRGAGAFVGTSAIQAPASLEIGVIFREVGGWTEDDNYGLQVFLGVQGALEQGGHRTALATLPSRCPSKADLEQLVEKMLYAPPHGFVLDERVPDGIVERLAASGRPAVVIGRRVSIEAASAAVCDMRGAGEAAARHFLEMGHRSVACLWRTDWCGDEAAQAFLNVMADNAAAVAPSHTAMADLFSAPQDVIYGVFRGVMSHPPVPTAVFCTDDRIARAFSAWARESGLRIPQDVSCAGVMDLAMAAINDPPLSTFRFNPEALGRAAVEEVVACCRDSQRKPGARLVPGEWVERGSVARILCAVPETPRLSGANSMLRPR